MIVNHNNLVKLINEQGACGDRLKYWAAIMHLLDIESVAEVGVWKGDFAAHALKHCEKIARYYLIDPWRKQPMWNKPFNINDSSFEEVRLEALSKTAFAEERIVELRETTKLACRQIPDSSVDLAYIDGDHTLRGITIDLISMLPKMKPGGLLAGDDFSLSPWQHSQEFEPTLIFPYAVYFAEAVDLPIYALGANQFLIHNDPSVGFKFIDLTNSYESLEINTLRAEAAEQ